MDSKKIFYIDNFRTVAITFIVLTHVVSFFDWSNNYLAKSILEILFSNSTSLFVFISGFLFRYLSASFEYRRYLFTKFKYVITPYLIISIPAIAYFVLFATREGVAYGFYEMPKIFQVVFFYLNGMHLAPYWYIPAISLFFLMSPVFIFLINRSLLLIVLPFLMLLSLNIAREGVLMSAIHFLSVYVAGMVVYQYIDKLKKIFTVRVMCLSASLMVFILFLQYKINIDSFRFMYVSKLLLDVWLILFLQKYFSKNIFSFDLSQTSFGIFFIHSYVITVLKIAAAAMFSSAFGGGIVEVILLLVIVLVFCHLSILATKVILGRYSRYFIGS